MSDTDTHDSTARQLSKLTPEDLDHVTMAATVDTSDRSPPRRNWIAERATQAERRFAEYIDGKAGATVGEPRERDHRTAHEESHGPEIVADVSACSPDVIADIVTATDTIEDWFIGEVCT